ncbi:MAG: hypothetical protein ABI054_06210 [Planctomycetota bacterium]
MLPSFLIAVVLFACFLVVLALIGFAAFRFAARREGTPLGFLGGCAVTLVLLGAGFFALVGFAILVGVGFVIDNRDEIEHHLRREFDSPTELEWDSHGWDVRPLDPAKPLGEKAKSQDDSVRQY